MADRNLAITSHQRNFSTYLANLGLYGAFPITQVPRRWGPESRYTGTKGLRAIEYIGRFAKA